MSITTPEQRRLRRRRRVRAKVRGTAERPRISVFRSNRGIAAQLVDDVAGKTIAAVQWTEPELRDLKKAEQSAKAGELLAERAKAAGIERAVFDRGGYQYHGRVKAFADGDKRSEGEATAALDHLGDAVDLDHPLLQVQPAGADGFDVLCVHALHKQRPTVAKLRF